MTCRSSPFRQAREFLGLLLLTSVNDGRTCDCALACYAPSFPREVRSRIHNFCCSLCKASHNDFLVSNIQSLHFVLSSECRVARFARFVALRLALGAAWGRVARDGIYAGRVGHSITLLTTKLSSFMAPTTPTLHNQSSITFFVRPPALKKC